jgi:glycosyltransferase involved in cell wall biosynthesis
MKRSSIIDMEELEDVSTDRSAAKWSVVVIIPCFNEAKQVGRVVREVLRRIPDVIVVDDGSTDGTAEVAARAGAKVIRHDANRGKGRALQSGWRYAREKGFAWALLMDGDGQHAPTDIPNFLDCARQTGAPLIIGNRMNEATTIPWVRRHVNLWMSSQLSKLTGISIVDSQCGYRLVNLEVLSGLAIEADRFEIESEMLVRFFAERQRVEFVPIQVIYKTRASKIHPFLDTWRWLRWRLGRGRLARLQEDARTVIQPNLRRGDLRPSRQFQPFPATETAPH